MWRLTYNSFNGGNEMDISLHDITKDNWEYVVSLTTNEDKRPSVVEKYVNGNAYSMLEALYNRNR